MFSSLRSRFILTHILPTLLVVPLAGLIILYLIETQILLNELSEDVAGQAALLAQILETDAAVWNDAEKAQFFVARISTAVSGNVVLLQPDGQLLAATSDDAASALTPLDEEAENQVSYTLFQQTAESIVPVYDLQDQLTGYVHVSSTLSDTSALFSTLRQLILISIVIELIAAVLIAIYLAVRLARPITHATTAVAQIAAGQRDQRVPEKGPREMVHLAQAVNQLSAQLQELEETRRKLLANLVHELGRPLGAMLAATNVLQEGAAEDPQLRQELLKGIENHIQQMQPLLDDLAQLLGKEMGLRQLNLQPIDLDEWLVPILLPWRAKAQEKGIQWQSDISTDLPILHIDPDRMTQALGNLLSNAIKFTPPEGVIRVTAVTTATELLITIQDSGPGITAAEQQRIFQPFYRSREHTRFPQGMGLGLAIAQELVTAHGGAVTVQSQTGSGSSFTIHLPLVS
jgi:signal transduction histidine kinase